MLCSNRRALPKRRARNMVALREAAVAVGGQGGRRVPATALSSRCLMLANKSCRYSTCALLTETPQPCQTLCLPNIPMLNVRTVACCWLPWTVSSVQVRKLHLEQAVSEHHAKSVSHPNHAMIYALLCYLNKQPNCAQQQSHQHRCECHITQKPDWPIHDHDQMELSVPAASALQVGHI